MRMKTQTMAINEQYNFQLIYQGNSVPLIQTLLTQTCQLTQPIWNKFQNMTKNVILNRQMILKSLQTSVTLQH
jgi:hypothetical protein